MAASTAADRLPRSAWGRSATIASGRLATGGSPAGSSGMLSTSTSSGSGSGSSAASG